MTENECIKSLNGIYPEWCSEKEEYEMAQVAIQALEEIQQYRAIGTVEEIENSFKKTINAFEKANPLIKSALDILQEYQSIGTIDEFKSLKEKKSEWKYSRKENIATCKNCSYEHYLGIYHQYATNYCPKCGSKMTET